MRSPHRPQPDITLDERKDRRFFALILAIAVIELWAVPLRSSLWLDETATFWIVKDGIPNLLTRSLNWAGQSPLYYLVDWVAFTIGGRQEWILRLPSFLASVVALWLLYKLASRLFDPATAQFAVLAFACAEPVAFAAADARPYGLALCLLIASALALLEWLDAGQTRYAVGYVLLTTLVLYAHCLFAPVLPALGGYALLRASTERKVQSWKFLAAWAAIGILALPLLAQLRHFYRSRGAHSFLVSSPGVNELLEVLAPPVLVGSIALGIFLVWLIFPHRLQGRFAARRESLLLATGWALTPPLILFVISVASPTKLFVSRYYLSYMPGLCLIAGWIAASAVAGRGRSLMATMLTGLSIVVWGISNHGPEDWSGAMRTIRSQAGSSTMPVVVASGFVEASSPQSLDDPQLREVLFAPQAMYPPTGPLVRLPYRIDAQSEPYVEGVLPALRQQSRFVLLTPHESLMFEPWFRSKLAPDGFRSQRLGNFGLLGVYLFSRDGAEPPGAEK
ncbi:MAG: glycosyltransferase family 39 protein [Ignavibacteriota bacterium]